MQNTCNGLIHSDLTSTEISGRYNFMVNNEKNTIKDVIKIIEVKPTDQILDVGSNDGKMAIPLSYLSKSVTCIDSLELNNYIKEKKINNINFYSGNFLDLDINEKFDKIVVYSVLQCLKKNEVFLFVDKCLDLLNLNGILLFGDIPNIDKKQRYLEKYQTEKEKIEWDKNFKNDEDRITHTQLTYKTHSISANTNFVIFDDDYVFELIKYIRKKGYNCYIKHQVEGLPYNKTREDIIVRNYC